MLPSIMKRFNLMQSDKGLDTTMKINLLSKCIPTTQGRKVRKMLKFLISNDQM
jgi:hypothetical protein